MSAIWVQLGKVLKQKTNIYSIRSTGKHEIQLTEWFIFCKEIRWSILPKKEAVSVLTDFPVRFTKIAC